MRRLFIAFIIDLITLTANAATAPDTIISFVNFYPGAEVYELEGHSALRVRTPFTDVAVSYGMFDFNSPNFLYRFVKGETDYCVGIIPWEFAEREYISGNRAINEHVLNLDSRQKQRLMELLAENLRPENRVYRYNYVLDNCATRPLAIVEKALGDSIVLSMAPADVGPSFRSSMRHYHRNYPWYQFGIDLCLGSGIDRPVSNREKSFAPVTLDHMLASATAGGKPLVSETRIIFDAPADAAVLEPTPWYLTPLFVCCVIFVAVALMTVRDVRRRRVTRWVDSVLFGVFGIEGCVLTFLIFVSVHEATSPNWLYLWLNPLCLIAAVGVWIKSARKLVMWYQIVNFAVVAGLCMAWPLTGQSANPAFVPLAAAGLMRSASYVYITYSDIKVKNIVSKKAQ